jgi:hypothetical protein
MLPEINEAHADFVLSYAKADGLNSLVRSISLDEKKDNVVADLQPDLIEAFSVKFPETSLTQLDAVVQWILITAVAKRKEERDDK